MCSPCHAVLCLPQAWGLGYHITESTRGPADVAAAAMIANDTYAEVGPGQRTLRAGDTPTPCTASLMYAAADSNDGSRAAASAPVYWTAGGGSTGASGKCAYEVVGGDLACSSLYAVAGSDVPSAPRHSATGSNESDANYNYNYINPSPAAPRFQPSAAGYAMPRRYTLQKGASAPLFNTNGATTGSTSL